MFTILLVFSSLLHSENFCIFGMFSSDFGFWYSRPHPDSLLVLNIFRVLASGLPLAKFPLAPTSIVTPLHRIKALGCTADKRCV